jgi:hypothetical protein
MTQFFTKVDIPKSGFKIDHSKRLYFSGSCFAENMGLRFQKLKFPVCVNPFGVQYNPLSIAHSLHLLNEKESFNMSDLLYENELWFSFQHYTLFSDTDGEKCLEKINSDFIEAKDFIRKSDVIVITLGTSWAYQLKPHGQIVNNCHKLPSSRFDRVFAAVEQTFFELKSAIEHVREINRHVKFIFTVSPIRHWKDGAIENQRSKASLLLAIAKLEKEVNDVYYFPAYEVMMDELRDYRFYASDMLHPSEQAIDYIWECFMKAYFEEDTIKIISEIQRMNNSLEHRPVHRSTSAYKKFISSLTDNLNELSKKYPYINFEKEKLELEEKKSQKNTN